MENKMKSILENLTLTYNFFSWHKAFNSIPLPLTYRQVCSIWAKSSKLEIVYSLKLIMKISYDLHINYVQSNCTPLIQKLSLYEKYERIRVKLKVCMLLKRIFVRSDMTLTLKLQASAYKHQSRWPNTVYSKAQSV